MNDSKWEQYYQDIPLDKIPFKWQPYWEYEL